MRTVEALLYAKLRILSSLLFDTRRKALLRNITTAFFLILLLYGAYLFFYSLVFTYVVKLEEIGFLLIERLISVGFLAFFIMLIISSFVISLASLFKSNETEYFFTTPVPVPVLFTGKYFDIIAFSSFSILLMVLPILYSYAKSRAFGTIEFALTGFFVLVPFIIISTSLGIIAAIIAIYCSNRISVKWIILLSIFLMAGLLYIFIRFSAPTQLVIPFTEDFRGLNLFINNFRLNSHPYTPNFWLIQSLRALVLHHYKDFFLYAGALISSALFFVSLLYVIVDRLFFPTWIISQEHAVIETNENGVSSEFGTGIFSLPASSQFRALLNKDVLLFVREPAQWSQLFLLFVLLSLYFFNIRLIPSLIEIEQWRTNITIINFGFCGFFLATLAVRFVYPSLSLEGNAIWVISSAPLSFSTLFREKFWSAFIPFFVITETIAIISGTLLNLEGMYQFITFAGIFIMSIALSSISVGFGAAFPDFFERNPSRIASSIGGILTIIISLFYIALMMALLAYPSYKYTEYLVSGGKFPHTAIVISLVDTIIVNIIAVVGSLYLGARFLKKREF